MVTRSAEDCVEAIYRLIKEKGRARISDISKALNVRPPSVTEMVQRLKGQGYVIYEKYRSVGLTPKGEKLAKSILVRHEILKEFLVMLGLSDKMAEEDACKIEHYLHPKTMERLTKFVEFVRTAPRHPKWLGHFEHYYKTGKRTEECLENTKY